MKYLFIRLRGTPGLNPKVKSCLKILQLHYKNLVALRDFSEPEAKGYFHLLTPSTLILELSQDTFKEDFERISSLVFPLHLDLVSRRKVNLRESFEKVSKNRNNIQFFIDSLRKNDK